jgi:SAM-dependent methyltransferase
MNSPDEYDVHQLAEPYRRSKELPFRVYSEIPNHLDLLGPLAGLDVLDLACGEGFYTRRIKQAGAGRVVGIDLAETMIKQARSQEQAEPLGIEYVLAKAEQPPDLGTFDLVSAAFLLCNAPDRETLDAMAHSIARFLKPGGRFVTTDARFAEHPNAEYRPYGMTGNVTAPLPDGAAYEITFFLDDGRFFTITNYAHKQSAYAAALQSAGLTDLSWHTPSITCEGLKLFGEAFWTEYLSRPPIMRLSARKPE